MEGQTKTTHRGIDPHDGLRYLNKCGTKWIYVLPNGKRDPSRMTIEAWARKKVTDKPGARGIQRIAVRYFEQFGNFAKPHTYMDERLLRKRLSS